MIMQLQTRSPGFMWIVAFVLLFTACESNVERSYWENGTLQSALGYNDAGELHGLARWFYEDGALQQEAMYRNNHLHGTMKRYHRNGQLESIAHYKNNLKDSVLIHYNFQGQKTGIEYYRRDTLHGTYSRFYNDGKPMIEGAYEDGFFHGLWLFFDAYGNVIGKADYVYGNGVQRAYYPNGKLKLESPYKNNLQHGTEKHYNAQGELERIIVYEEGEMISETFY